jgi:hypothetical protein
LILWKGEAFDSPQNHLAVTKILFGHQTAKALYVSKKKVGTAYATSTNTIYEYNLETKITKKHNRI